jgi:chromosome segregation ATPase
MEYERYDSNEELRIEYLLERVNDIEMEIFNLQNRIDRLNEQASDAMRLLEQSIRVVEYLQNSRLHNPSGATSGCEAPSQS